MPHDPMHERKKSKNYTMLAILLSVVAIFFAIGMIKMSGRM